MKIYSLFILFILGSVALAQKQELTLEDAVLQQYRKFLPEQITMFQWLPEGNEYSHLEGYRTLKIGQAGGEEQTWGTIDEVNKALGSELRWFSGMHWKDAKSFYLSDGQNYYLIDRASKKGELISAIGDKAANADIHYKSGNVAYTRENNLYIQTADGRKIKVTSNDDPNIVSGQAIARSEFGITKGTFWSPNGNFLAFYQKDESKVHDYPLLDNSAYPGSLRSIKYPMAGQSSETSAVGIYNLATGETIYIKPQGEPEDYLTNLSWTPNEKYVIIAEVNRDQNHMRLQKYEAISGMFKYTLFEEKNEKWVEPEHPAFFPKEDSEDFIWLSEKDGFMNLYFYTEGGKLKKQLTSNKFVTKGILCARNKGNDIYFTATGPDATNTLLYKVNLKGKQTLISNEEGTHNTEISADGSFIFDQYSTHEIPNISCLYKSNGKNKVVLIEAKNPYENLQIGRTEIGSIEGPDGSKLHTRLIKPSDFDSTQKYPVLVYVYGGPHAQLITNRWGSGASLWMQWMAEQGYLVFTLDNRGSAERGFEFESQIHRQLGTVEMEDQLAGVDYLKSLEFVDGDRIAVHGWSFGGFMTTSLMLRQPGTFTCGVAGGPVIDWKYYEIMYGERYMDRPEENEEGYAANSLLNYADKLEGDLLLIHGTVDDVVVMQHSLDMVQKFVEAGVQMDFFPYPMHPHNVRGKDRVHLMRKVLDYVIEHNQ